MNQRKIYKNYLIAFFCLIFSPAFAQTVELPSAAIALNVTPYAEIYRDKGARLNLKQALHQPYQKSTKDYFISPYSNDAFWLRLTLKNNCLTNKDWVLVWVNPLAQQLDFYAPDSTNRQFVHQQQKILTHQKERKLMDEAPAFSFELKPLQTKTIYIKLTSKRGHYATLRLHSKQSHRVAKVNDFIGQGFLNGLLFFRLALVLVLSWLIIKDFAFRLYSLHAVIKTLNYWGYVNIIGPIFANDPDLAHKIDFVCYNSATVSSGIFLLFAIQNSILPKWHSWVTRFILLFTVFLNTVIFFDYQWYWLKAGVYSIVFSALYFIFVYGYSIVKKVPFAKFYSVLFLLGLISSLLLYIRLLGWIQYQPLYSIAYYFFLFEIFAILLFLGRIFSNTEQNKRIAERQLAFNLEQAQRLKELDQLKTNFFANISHEFRTPLTLILGPIEDKLKKNPTDGVYQIVYRNATRLLQLINQLLDLSKLEAQQMEVETTPTDLPKFFRTLVSAFASLAESKNIRFQFEQSPGEVHGLLDHDKAEKILTNLLSNAFKFTPNGGQVNVRIQYTDHIEIQVQDSGIGIEKEKRNKIFNRFYQVDEGSNRHFEGTGIGLALVKELVDVLNGTIRVESEVGLGTTFFVTLPSPLTRAASRPDGGTSQVVDHAPLYLKEDLNPIVPPSGRDAARGLRLDNVLLIVDDNADIRAYIRSIFEADYHIIEAVNGKDGLAKAFESTPNLIISDLMMPEMDGFEFCKTLKTDERTSHIPVVMLTAKANVESRIEGFELGADEYLVKPFHTDEIRARVRNLLDKQRKLQALFSQKIIAVQAETLKNPSAEDAFLVKVKQIVEQNLANSKFDVDQFCGEIGMSRSQLLRKIKAISNLTVVEFVRDYRLQRAADMLMQHGYTVAEIASEVGFESPSYFAKSFQDKYGKLPSEF